MLDQLRSLVADMDLNMDITLKEESEYEKD